MGKLRKTIKIQEGILYPIPFRERSVMGKLKPFVFLIDGLIILLSLLLRENLYMELAAYSKVVIAGLTIAVLFVDVDRWGPSEMELSFYDDRMVLYRDRVVRGKHLFRREYECMLYKDVKECKYRKVSKQIEFFGIVTQKYNDYDKDGTVKPELSRDKTSDTGIWFYTNYTDVQEVIKEIEQNTPLKVEERES